MCIIVYLKNLLWIVEGKIRGTVRVQCTSIIVQLCVWTHTHTSSEFLYPTQVQYMYTIWFRNVLNFTVRSKNKVNVTLMYMYLSLSLSKCKVSGLHVGQGCKFACKIHMCTLSEIPAHECVLCSWSKSVVCTDLPHWYDPFVLLYATPNVGRLRCTLATSKEDPSRLIIELVGTLFTRK